MSDAFCPNGKWDWKSFEGMVDDVKRQRSQPAQPVNMNMG